MSKMIDEHMGQIILLGIMLIAVLIISSLVDQADQQSIQQEGGILHEQQQENQTSDDDIIRHCVKSSTDVVHYGRSNFDLYQFRICLEQFGYAVTRQSN